jgi:hypothetical protein
MRWVEFQNRKQQYSIVWEALLTEFGGDIRKFLNQSYLVIVYGSKQMPFELSDSSTIAVEYPDFYIADVHSERLLMLGTEYKSIKDQNSEHKRDLLKEMQAIKPERLSVVDFTVEVRFSILKFDFIQTIKLSKHCDKELMDMSKVSIRVVLKL